jgi:DNA-directed RNA polymerase specialized sigma24 family protein
LTLQDQQVWDKRFSELLPHVTHVARDLYRTCAGVLAYWEVQEACHDAIEDTLRNYQPSLGFALVTLYRCIARRRVADRVGKKQGCREVQIEEFDVNEVEDRRGTGNPAGASVDPLSPGQVPEEFLEQLEDADRQVVSAILAGLTPGELSVLWSDNLYDIPLSPSEQAAARGVSEDVIRQWRRRGRKKLERIREELIGEGS